MKFKIISILHQTGSVLYDDGAKVSTVVYDLTFLPADPSSHIKFTFRVPELGDYKLNEHYDVSICQSPS